MDEKKDKIAVYMPHELKLRAQEKANSLGFTLSGIMIIAINEYLKQDSVVDMAVMFKELNKQQIKK